MNDVKQADRCDDALSTILTRSAKYAEEYRRNRELGHSHAFCNAAALHYALTGK